MANKSKQNAERQARIAAQQAKQKRNERIAMWCFIALGVALVVGVTLAIVLSLRPVEHLADPNQYPTSTEATNRVKLNISYTDANGTKHVDDIIVELDPEAAPITVANFQKLVREGFYDGLVFHRVIENFMIQGGGFDESLVNKEAASIKGEFSANGVNNPLKHERGVISMARTSVNDSASSQFFIMHKTYPSLDGQYAAFGRVIFGLETVDAIAAIETDEDDRPLDPPVINSATFVE